MFIKNLLKFVFPNRCVVCDSVLPYSSDTGREYICSECIKNLELIKEPTCKKCGAMLSDSDDDFCTRCKKDLHSNFEYGFGLLRYNDFVRDSLHKIKYSGRKEYISFYGKAIAKMCKDRFAEIKPDYFVPVPIHKRRLKKRNYNQSSVLAHVISDELKRYDIDIPVKDDLVFRAKDTQVLNKLDKQDRISELSGAFYAENAEHIDKVLIVDDIYTTGTTIDEIAKVLKSVGVRKVYFVVIAVVDNL